MPSQTLAFTKCCLDHYPPWNRSHLGDLPPCPLSTYPPLCPLSLSFIYQLIVIFCNYGMFSLIILYFCIKSFSYYVSGFWQSHFLKIAKKLTC